MDERNFRGQTTIGIHPHIIYKQLKGEVEMNYENAWNELMSIVGAMKEFELDGEEASALILCIEYLNDGLQLESIVVEEAV